MDYLCHAVRLDERVHLPLHEMANAPFHIQSRDKKNNRHLFVLLLFCIR